MTAQIITPADARDHVHDDIIQPSIKVTRLVSNLIPRDRQVHEDRDGLILFNIMLLGPRSHPAETTKEAKIQGLKGEKKLGTSRTFTIHRRYLKCNLTMAIL